MDRRALGSLPILVLAALAALGVLGFGGCGEKIAIPVPEGLFSVSSYTRVDQFEQPDLRQVVTVQGNLYVLSANSLVKRNQSFTEVVRADGFADARAACANAADSLVFVWDQGLHRVTYLSVQSLAVRGHADLPSVPSVTSMTTCSTGVEEASGAATFLYLSDPDSAVVHRYAFFPTGELLDFGILCNAGGDGARFVHEPAGVARDSRDGVLVCDADSLRNWVIRFDSTPDLTDTAPGSLPDPLRGQAALWDLASCNPPAASDYALGNAPGCDPSGWAPGPSDSLGFFDRPMAIAVDGEGKVFVADTANDRIQVFTSHGVVSESFGSPTTTPSPTSLATVDDRWGAGSGDIDYAAFVYVVCGNIIYKMQSGDSASRESQN